MGGRSYWKKVPLLSACSPKEYEDTLAKTKSSENWRLFWEEESDQQNRKWTRGWHGVHVSRTQSIHV